MPRISDLGHLYSSSLGKLELDLMGSHQMSERQVLEAIIAEAIQAVFTEYVDKHGLGEIAEIFRQRGQDRSGATCCRPRHTPSCWSVWPPIWEKAFEVNASSDFGRAGLLH